MSDNGRIERFVRAARSLLLMQLVAALLAVALSVWAVVAVWELAAERDRLRAQLDSVQSGQPTAAASEAPLSENPIANEVRPPAIMAIPIPISEAPADVNMILPDPVAVPPATNQTAEPVPATPPAPDCTGADAGQPRCRPGRWNRPVPQRPVPHPRPEPQQPTTPDPAPQ